MAKVSGIGIPNFSGKSNAYVQRTSGDNLEFYVNSELNKLSKQTVADTLVKGKLNSLRKFTAGKKSA